MLSELRQLDLETLKQMFALETDKLRQSLLTGASWEDVQQQRYRLIDFEVALYQKMRYQPGAVGHRRLGSQA
ncbi:MAG: hypothetical protein JWP27_2624 [Flaviaesturariibacter sp.]|nr:hypothetical protein [Flaviaesturariibacter sp.]